MIGGARRALVAGVPFVLAAGLLFANARANVAGADLAARLPGWRGWDDVAIAAAYRVSGEYPVASYRIANRFRRDQEDFLAFRAKLLAATARARIGASQFWRTIDDEVFRDDERFLARRWDDAGRALLLALAFDALHGVAPFLICWVAVLLAAPVLLWIGWEIAAAGRPVAAAAVMSLLAASGFVVDVLMHAYSSAGFSLLALLLVVALASHAILGQPTPRGLLLRALFAGLGFGWLALARSASLLTLGGATLALFVGAKRAVWNGAAGPSRRHWRVGALFLSATALYLVGVPLAGSFNERELDATLLRLHIPNKPAQQHDVWITLWQGLGDFDRTKGHAFLDEAGALEARRHGLSERLSPASEKLFRSLLLRDISEDPLWYAEILAERTAATLTLRKLWPWGPRDGRSFEAARHPAEGVTDVYYGMVVAADVMRLGRRAWELPISALLAPALTLLVLALMPPRAMREGVRRGLAVVACAALAALPAPVLVTTSSAFEVESFVVVHLLAAAFLLQALADLSTGRN